MSDDPRDKPAADRPETIPFPGACTRDGEMRWLCLTCGKIHPIFRASCHGCGQPRDDELLGPWIALASRTVRLMSPVDGRGEPGVARTEAFRRFARSAKLSTESWADGEHYDLAALDEIDVAERPLVVALLADRESTWRESDVLARVANEETPGALAMLGAALTHHLSSDARLSAAGTLHRLGLLAEPIDALIAREIRNLSEPRNGLERAVALARAHPTESVQQALLFASVNATPCAPACALTLCEIRGVASDPKLAELLPKIGLHVSSFDRRAGFDALCELVGMTLET